MVLTDVVVSSEKTNVCDSLNTFCVNKMAKIRKASFEMSCSRPDSRLHFQSDCFSLRIC